MGKYYYWTANTFEDDGIHVINGAHYVDSGDFPISLVMQNVAEDCGIAAKSVLITFFAEISEKEFKKFKNIVNNRDYERRT